MPAIVKPLRFAHSEGNTDVCYDESGEHLLTCGSDGDIRIYKGFDDSDPESIQAGELVTMVAVKNKRIFAAPDNFAVQAFTFPEGSADGILTRFTAPVNHMCFNQSGTVIAAGSSDFTIKAVTLDDSSQKSFRGHEAPVLAVTLDPKDVYLASSSCDGSVKIWKLEDQTTVKSFDNLLPKTNDASASKSLSRLAWQPGSGKYLAIPVGQGVKVYERDTWSLVFSLTNEGHTEIVSLVSWSPCGNFIASASIDGTIIIWNINSQLAVERIQHENKFPICNLVWNPLGNREIAYVDNQGQFGLCENVIPEHATAKNKHIQVADENDAMVDAMIAGQYDSDNDSLVATKRHRVKTAWMEDDDDDDDEDDEFKDIRKLKAQLAAPLDFAEDAGTDAASDVSAPTKKPAVVHVPYMPTLQSPFQPGSTPTHLMHRFMVWNSVGIVRCHTEDDLSSIEVEFHDTSTHHPLHLTNHLDHSMAALSTSAVFLACKAQDDVPSKLVCLHFGSWDSSKEWTIDIPAGEDIEAVAAGDTWVAVATNSLLVRILTVTGIQRHMMSLPGPVVAMSGHGSQLFITYHAGNPLPNEQSLGMKILDIAANRQVVADHRITISKKSTLAWMGFSEEGTPVTADSTGVIRMLNRSFGNVWTPVLNTKSQLKGKSDNYWVVGMEERSQQLRCILSKGSTYPPTLPRPILVLLPLKLPLCEMTTDKGEREENYMKSCLLANNYRYRGDQGIDYDENEAEHAKTTQIQTLMRLFALACKTDREFRAAQYCELLPDQRSVSLAIKYAAGNRKMNLAQRLNDLALRKAQEEEAQENGDEFDDFNERPRYSSTGRDTGRSTGRSSGRGTGRQCQDEAEDDDDMEVENEAYEEVQSHRSRTTDRKGLARLDSTDDADRPNPLLRRPTTKAEAPTSSPALNATPNQGRSNPFKMLSPSKRSMGACGKSFFKSVEEEKTALVNKPKISPKSNTKSKKPKQMTLMNRTQKNDKPAEKTAKPEERQAKKKNGFTLWMEDNRASIAEDHPEASDGELIKLAMKQWRALDDEEKKKWNEQAKGTAAESDDKKRKRENNENDVDNSCTPPAEKISKKIKAVGTEGSNSKLAGFAYSKN